MGRISYEEKKIAKRNFRLAIHFQVSLLFFCCLPKSAGHLFLPDWRMIECSNAAMPFYKAEPLPPDQPSI